MAITLLPKPAIAQLGSTLTIASSAVLVKELLDNSLDAGSTAVDIFISTDTVERIEVRDNGCGIPAEDFHLLGQRSCTSKLDNVGDLERIGGSSLGFRGQALASIHELADVAIVTRTSQETVGSVLRLSPEGGAIKVQSKASPPGTTVTVHGLFQCFPVRRRVAEAGAKKTVASITELLKGYAMARPHVRLSFKILGKPDQAWLYAPRLRGDIKEAVMQLLGTELVSQCSSAVVSWPKPTSGDTPDPLRAPFIFESCIPRLEAEPSQISFGPFISVDSRPLSPERGTVKAMYAMFKSYLGEHTLTNKPRTSFKKPFLRLNIRCPPGSYDVNVAPIKDELVFADERQLLDAFGRFLREVYAKVANHASGFAQGTQPVSAQIPAAAEETHETRVGSVPIRQDQLAENPSGLEQRHLLTASSRRGQCDLIVSDDQVQDTEPSRNVTGNSRKDDDSQGVPNGQAVGQQPLSSWSVNMGAKLDDNTSEDSQGEGDMPCRRDESDTTPPAIDGRGLTAEGLPVTDTRENLNPWTIAKVVASIKPRHQKDTLDQERKAPLAAIPPGTHLAEGYGSDDDPPVLRPPCWPNGDLEVPRPPQQQLTELVQSPRTKSSLVSGGPYRRPAPRFDPHTGLQSPPSTSPARRAQNHAHFSRHQDLVSTKNSELGPSRISFPNLTVQRQPRGRQRHNVLEEDEEHNRQGVSTASDVGVARQHLPLTNDAHEQPTQRSFHMRQTTKLRGGTSRTSPQNDGTQARELDAGKIRHRDGVTDLLESTEGTSRETIMDAEPVATQMDSNDARAYLFRRQRSVVTKSPRKRRRALTDLMPLEHATADQRTHDVRLTLALTMEVLDFVTHMVGQYDTYAGGAGCDLGLDLSEATEDTALVDRVIAEFF